MGKITGIYKITNPKGSIYIGQSVNIRRRWREHKRLMYKYKSKLNSSFKKYGFDNHKFEIIHQCNRDELNGLEIYYISLYQSFDSKYGLNLTTGGNSNDQFIYSKSEEFRRKQSEAMKGNKRAFKPNKIKKEKQCDWGKNGCRIVSSIKDGVIVKTYNSIVDASKDVGVKPSSLSTVLRGITKSSAGYYWIYGDVFNIESSNSVKN